jgi:predicted amidohydrolase
VMQGAAVGNRMHIVAVNRIGVETATEEWDAKEKGTEVSLSFYGESFITEIDGSIKAENAAPRYSVKRSVEECTTIVSQRINVSEVERERKLWRVEERRPDLAHRIVKPLVRAYEFTKSLIHSGSSLLSRGADKKENTASISGSEYSVRNGM